MAYVYELFSVGDSEGERAGEGVGPPLPVIGEHPVSNSSGGGSTEVYTQ